MSVADMTLSPEGTPTAPNVTRTLDKIKTRHRTWMPYWAENLAFVEGRQFVFRARTSSGVSITELDTHEWGSKPQHKARTVRNRIIEFYLNEVSAGTQRIPSYDVTPTNTDPQVIGAARLSEKVLLYLYDYLGIRKEMVEAYGYAVSCGEGFLRPWWNEKAGDPLPPDPENPEEQLFTGDLCLDAFGPHEVAWMPGTSFEKSPVHVIFKAMSIEEAKGITGYLGGDLKPDVRGADTFVNGQLNKSAAVNDLVTVAEWLELPCNKYPEGRRVFYANGRQITPVTAYPMIVRGPNGYEPCIHKVRYIPTPWRDRDMGLVEHLVDPQRTINDCVNKMIEWKNLALVPQILAAQNQMITRPTNEPGAVIEYRPVGSSVPTWRPTPPIPKELQDMVQAAVEDMEAISSRRSIPPQVDTARGLSSFVEREASVHQFILQGLADTHSTLARHLLIYVQQYFTEPRLLQIQGRNGLEFIPDFKGADLKDQVSVRVLPGSIEPRTKESLRQQVMNYAQLGWISPEQAMSAIDGGYAEDLADEYELDVARQQRENQQMLAMGDPNMPGGGVPQAKPYDNHTVHLGVLHRYMKTAEFERQPPGVQEAMVLHEQMHQQLEAQAAAEAAQAQEQQAQGLGMSNAAKPAQASPMPSLPSTSSP